MPAASVRLLSSLPSSIKHDPCTRADTLGQKHTHKHIHVRACMGGRLQNELNWLSLSYSPMLIIKPPRRTRGEISVQIRFQMPLNWVFVISPDWRSRWLGRTSHLQRSLLLSPGWWCRVQYPGQLGWQKVGVALKWAVTHAEHIMLVYGWSHAVFPDSLECELLSVRSFRILLNSAGEWRGKKKNFWLPSTQLLHRMVFLLLKPRSVLCTSSIFLMAKMFFLL